MTTSILTYKAKIEKALLRLGQNGTENPDNTSNSGRLIGDCFLWDEVERFAKSRSKEAWDVLDKSGLLEDSDQPGESEIASSSNFAITLRVSEPVKRFDETVLAELLNKRYKVPRHVTKELVELSKVPTKSTKTYKVIEKV